jgi:hypothetical protein
VFEARKNGMIGAEVAANLTEVPNIPQKGTRLGNWLTREQAKELLAVPDRSTLKPRFRKVGKSIPLIPGEIAQDSPCGYWEHPDQFVGPGL